MSSPAIFAGFEYEPEEIVAIPCKLDTPSNALSHSGIKEM